MDMPTIEHCFAVYLRTLAQSDIDPFAEDEQRRAYFCGFESAMIALDSLAEVSEKNEAEGEQAYQLLRAEFDKFATEVECGKKSTDH